MAIFCCSPMPSQRMVSGIHVIAANGRSSEMNGSAMAFAGHHTAMITPSGTATTPASTKPANTRSDETSTDCNNSPLASSSRAWAITCPGVGRNTDDMAPLAVDMCHANTNTPMEATQMSGGPNLTVIVFVRNNLTVAA